MNMSDFQLMMRNIYFHRDAERGIGPTFAWLVEEVGELGRALMARDVNVDDVREEFADVMAWLTSAANVAGIDLEKATLTKYDGKCPRCRESRCCCPMVS